VSGKKYMCKLLASCFVNDTVHDECNDIFARMQTTLS
jgi:hypothetical protein